MWNNVYSWLSVSVHSQPGTENTVLHPQLIEFADVKPGDVEG